MKLEEQPRSATAHMAETTSSELLVLLQLIVLFALGYFLTRRCFVPRCATLLLGSRALPTKKLELEGDESPGLASPADGAEGVRRRKANKRRRMRKAAGTTSSVDGPDVDGGSIVNSIVEGEESRKITEKMASVPSMASLGHDGAILVELHIDTVKLSTEQETTADKVAEDDARIQEPPAACSGDIGGGCVPSDERAARRRRRSVERKAWEERPKQDKATFATAAVRDSAEVPGTGISECIPEKQDTQMLDFEDSVSQAVGDTPEAPAVSVTNDMSVGASGCVNRAEVNTCEPEEGGVYDESASLRLEQKGSAPETRTDACREALDDTLPSAKLEDAAYSATTSELGEPPCELSTDDEFEHLSAASHNEKVLDKLSPPDSCLDRTSVGVTEFSMDGIWQTINGEQFVVDIGGETYHAQLDDDGLYFRWSKGDLCTRVLDESDDSWMQPIVEDDYQQQHLQQSDMWPDVTQSHIPCLVTEEDMGVALMMGGVVASPKENWEACWDWAKKGWCPRGNACEWEHPPLFASSMCQPCTGFF